MNGKAHRRTAPTGRYLPNIEAIKDRRTLRSTYAPAYFAPTLQGFRWLIGPMVKSRIGWPTRRDAGSRLPQMSRHRQLPVRVFIEALRHEPRA